MLWLCYKPFVSKGLPLISWREWISLPELGITRIAAKVDTGAKTSALHARDVVAHTGGWVEFTAPLLNWQSHMDRWDARGVRRVRARLVENRLFRSSNGQDEERFVVCTPVSLRGVEFVAEFSLTTRSRLSYPVLLGRSALEGRFWVDAAMVSCDVAEIDAPEVPEE